MANLMSVKEYDLTEITKTLLKMRDNCVRKDSNVYDDPEREEKYAALNDVITLINNPSLLKPVRHGRWIGIEYDGYADGCPVYDVWECSECGYEHKGEYDTLTNYCPDCGAKMDEEVSHETN